jgi:hypothetical protein
MRWIIGDVHGMLRPLEAVVAYVRKLDSEAQFYFTGDYVNRGAESKQVIDFLMRLEGARFCRGNHDDAFDEVINGTCYSHAQVVPNPLVAFVNFMQYGLANTLASYGVDIYRMLEVQRRPTPEAIAELTRVVPDDHRRWIRQLPPVVEDDDLFVAHAQWDTWESTDNPRLAERLELDPRLRHRIIWGRYSIAEIIREKSWQRRGFFGHTPVINYPDLLPDHDIVPIQGPSIVLLDTGAALGGRLTAWCAETHEFVQSDPRGHMMV